MQIPIFVFTDSEVANAKLLKGLHLHLMGKCVVCEGKKGLVKDRKCIP